LDTGTIARDTTHARARASEPSNRRETPFLRKDKRKAIDLQTLDRFAQDEDNEQ
jgi:hypothetical protein